MGINIYPIELKKSMVSRFLSDPKQGIVEFSRENGISRSSLRDWIRKSEMGILDDMGKTNHFKYQTLSDKFSAILEYEKQSEEDKGKWLRLNGLKAERLEVWKKELSSSLNTLDDKSLKKAENQQIKKLERELARKDKALAEASTLLLLKKKLESIYGLEDEEK